MCCKASPKIELYIETAFEILSSMTEMFADKSRSERQAALKAIMNTRMAKGTSVREHMLKMMAHFNDAEVLGAILRKKLEFVEERVTKYLVGSIRFPTFLT